MIEVLIPAAASIGLSAVTSSRSSTGRRHSRLEESAVQITRTSLLDLCLT